MSTGYLPIHPVHVVEVLLDGESHGHALGVADVEQPRGHDLSPQVVLVVQREFLKTGFHAICYIGTMPRIVQIETWFFGIIHCTRGPS